MHPGRLAWVRFKRGVLGTGGRYGRGLGVGEGGERGSFDKCSKQWLPSVRTKHPKKEQEGASLRVLGGWVPSSEQVRGSQGGWMIPPGFRSSGAQ